MKLIISAFLTLFFISGCTNNTNLFQEKNKTITYQDYKNSLLTNVRDANYNKPYANTPNVYQNLNGAILAIADQLLTTNIKKQNKTKIILTSFVDLSKLNKTTTFGRILSESMFNELHIRQFKVTDFRGQDSIVVNANGEFHITRDVKKLKDHIDAIEYVVVGTYVGFEMDSVLVNARILDSISGEVISSARIIYTPKDCSLFDICNNNNRKSTGIKIISDNCSPVSCPSQQCKNGICNN